MAGATSQATPLNRPPLLPASPTSSSRHLASDSIASCSCRKRCFHRTRPTPTSSMFHPMLPKLSILLMRIAAMFSISASAGVVPNDPSFNQQWSLAKIGATNAWATTTGSTEIVVAVLDTGVDYTHPDLAPNMWRNPGETGLDAQGRDKATNGVDDDGDGYIDDVHGVD